jgi:ATP-dependent helicase HepA
MGQAKLQRTCDKCGLNGKYRPKRWSFQRGEQEIEKGLERMKRTLNHEINRLTALQKKNTDIRPDEIQAAVEERNTFSIIIKKARIQLDALQLISEE